MFGRLNHAISSDIFISRFHILLTGTLFNSDKQLSCRNMESPATW